MKSWIMAAGSGESESGIGDSITTLWLRQTLASGAADQVKDRHGASGLPADSGSLKTGPQS
jgi:hypothetical protein